MLLAFVLATAVQAAPAGHWEGTLQRGTARPHGNERVISRVFPGADHTLRVAPHEAGGWPHNATGFPEIVVTFARGELNP
jgi:hypothetical protein